jgi:hypothetical protein
MGVALWEASELKNDMLQQMNEMKATMSELVVWGASISRDLTSNPPVILVNWEKAKVVVSEGPPTSNLGPT